MRVLVLGGDGMLGHRVVRHFARRYDTAFTVRGSAAPEGLPAAARFTGVDVRDLGGVTAVFAAWRPDVVVNGTGLVKQRPQGQAVVEACAVNAVAPHRLADLCRLSGARFVQISTDCVFSGRRGLYGEDDPPDPVDVYGMTKLLGEVAGPGCLTLRTSLIGRELKARQGLLEWFLAQSQPVQGYRRAVFSGVTTVELARILENVLTRHPDASGVYHLSAAPISKHDLLHKLARHYRHPVPILADDAVVLDRSLDSTRFRTAFGCAPPDWDTMLSSAAAADEEDGRTAPPPAPPSGDPLP